MSDLKALLDRVEKATGPDRELDGAIAAACGKPHGPHEYIEDRSFISTEQQADCFTSSLDAVLSLVEEKGFTPRWAHAGRSSWMWAITTKQAADALPDETCWDEWDGSAHHTSPALALLSALLTALIAKQETEAKVDG